MRHLARLIPAFLAFVSVLNPGIAAAETPQERRDLEQKRLHQINHHLGAARDQLDAGEFQEALDSLDTYEKMRAGFEAEGFEFGAARVRLIYRAEALQGLGHHDEALALGEKLVEDSPDWEESYIERARIRHRAEKWDDAVADFDKAFELTVADSGNNWRSKVGRIVAARALSHWGAERKVEAVTDELAAAGLNDFFKIERALASDDPTEAGAGLAKLTALIKILPDVPDHYVLRASVYAADGKTDLADADWKNAIALAPGDPGHLAQFARYLADQKRFDEALVQSGLAVEAAGEDAAQRRNQLGYRGAIHLAAGNFKEAIADFDASIVGGAEEERELRARAHLALGDHKTALEDAVYNVDVIRKLNRDGALDEELADALRLKAEILTASGDGDGAKLANAEAQHLTNRAAAVENYQRGVQLFNGGDYRGSVDALTKAVELDPENTRYLGDRLQVFAMAGDFDAALKDGLRHLELEPDSLDSFNYLGFIYGAQQNFAEALTYFEKALVKEPQNIRVLRNVAGSHGQLGQAEEEATYRKKIREILVADGGAARAAQQFFLWGEEYQEKGEDEFAINEYNDAIALAPDEYKYRIERARCLINSGRWKESLADTDAVIEGHPEVTDGYFLRGTALMESDDISSALPDLDRAIELDPEHEWILFNRGIVHEEMGSLDKAVADFKRSSQLIPDDLEPLERIVTIYRNSGEDEKCLQALEALLAVQPDHDYGLFLVSQLHEQAERYAEAEAAIDRYIEHFPDDPNARNNRGWYRLKQGKIEAALADFDSSLELEPDEPMTHKNRILALEKLGRTDDVEAAKKKLAALKAAAVEEGEGEGEGECGGTRRNS